jgi:hypothetical protein
LAVGEEPMTKKTRASRKYCYYCCLHQHHEPIAAFKQRMVNI